MAIYLHMQMHTLVQLLYISICIQLQLSNCICNCIYSLETGYICICN